MATGFGTALAQSSERAAQVNERIAVSKMVAATRARTGAKWFYWIAALSMINSIIVITGGSFHFVVGLGITSVVDAFAKRLGSAGSVLDVVINGFVAGLFVLFGTFAVKAQKWAFILGMALYGLDGVLLLGIKDYLSAGFHAYALYAIYNGYTASKRVQVF
jgi:hypothetical protein